MKPCSLVEVYWSFGGTYRLHSHGWRVNWLLASSAYSTTMKMEPVSSSETSVNFYQTACCYITRQYSSYSPTWQLISHNFIQNWQECLSGGRTPNFTAQPSKVAQAVRLLVCIQKVHGLNLGRNSDRHDWNFRVFFLSIQASDEMVCQVRTDSFRVASS
jgi:hypothetical protein